MLTIIPTLFDSLNLNGRVALITGASKGIGRATAMRLAQCGVSVTINYLHDEAGARAAVEEIEAVGGSAVAAQGDVRNVVEAERLVRYAVEEFGRLDVLVCNAGIWEGAPADRMDEELWDRTIEINLRGTWTICRAAIPQLKEGGAGRIVVVSSTAGQRGEENYSNYAASKGGQIAFVKSLAVELARFGVTVNAVAPGWVQTEMTASELSQRARREEIEGAIPLGRIATPDDIALPICFLCSDWARHITGEVININGGSVLCG